VARLSVASALASSVLPLPGGPYSRMPRTGARRPEKMSARNLEGRSKVGCVGVGGWVSVVWGAVQQDASHWRMQA
jgi:hypothetical protein